MAAWVRTEFAIKIVGNTRGSSPDFRESLICIAIGPGAIGADQSFELRTCPWWDRHLLRDVREREPGTEPAGALDPNVWGVSRTTGKMNSERRLTVGRHRPGSAPATLAVLPGNTYNPQWPASRGQQRQRRGAFETATVIVLTMYPKQPFDFAGRTGTVSFDVSNDIRGSHVAWPKVWITTFRCRARSTISATWQALPQFGFGIRLDGYIDGNGNANSCPAGQNGIRCW